METRNSDGKEIHPIRLMIVDDHAIVRLGLRSLFENDTTIEVIGDAELIATGYSEAIRLKPDVVLLDLRLPDGSGAELCRDLKEELPDTRCIILSTFTDEEAVFASVLAGANGYILKGMDSDKLRYTVELVASGYSIFDYKVTEHVRMSLRNLNVSDRLAQDWDLPPQQQAVFALVAQGKTNKEIARELNLSEKTVRNYLSIIFDKLNITRRIEAAILYAQNKHKE